MITGSVAMERNVERNMIRLACLVLTPSCCHSITGMTADGKDTPSIRIALAASLIGRGITSTKNIAGIIMSFSNEPSQANGSLKISLILFPAKIAPVYIIASGEAIELIIPR